MLYIDLPTRSDLDVLLAHRGTPAVSIYLATTPLTQEAQADRIELKNLARTAVSEMEAGGTQKRQVLAIEAAIEAVIDDDGFWAVQANSLALFVTPERIRTFRLPNRLQSLVEVSDRFHLKPLIRAVTFPQNAWVLAIGMGGVRLVEVTADLPAHEVKVPDLPKDMASALGRRSHGERTGPGRSGEETSEHALLTRYARAVDQALRPVIAGDARPLIVAAAEPLASVYRAVSTYPATATAVIPGAADRTPDAELAAAARGVLDGIYAEELGRLAETFALRGQQGRAVTDVAQAARAATFGAVDTLVVDMDATVAGTVDEETGAVSFGEAGRVETYGVVDEIARRTLAAGGRVVSARRADVPGGGDLAAILRYPV
ncbi:MAG TPA: hypothetical protein VFN28_03435 [Amaricoccus sp.]|nr:hypothetical protein [Amaricoccus sp.]